VDVESFVSEPNSQAQCMTLEENVKAFGITYFGMTDKRQTISHRQQALIATLTLTLDLVFQTGHRPCDWTRTGIYLTWHHIRPILTPIPTLTPTLTSSVTTLVCGDSHTATHGAFGSIAFGIGTSEV